MIDPALAAELATVPLQTGFADGLGQFLRPSNLASVLVEGLAKSAIYVMIASGLTLIFGLMGVLNFAHGSLTMIGAYLAGVVMVVLVGSATGQWTRLAYFFGALAVVFGALVLLGGVMEVGLIRKLYDRPPIYQILLTFGLTLVLEEVVRIVVQFYGLQPLSEWQGALGTKPGFLATEQSLGPLSIRGLAVFEILLGIATVAAIWAFLTRTRYGLYIRAGSEDTEMAEALGIDVRRVFTVVFALGAGIAGVAGALLMWDPVWGASVPLAAEALLPAFVVVIIGGLGTFRGTVAGALVVGMADATTTWWFQNVVVTWTWLPQMTVFLILVGMLVVKPQGLYGVEEVGGH
ncbi:branched-chain amino acid ABC transporter permease [Halosimplex amylolyticum]|uniref:branched-chain amino acid ABC transporter permease n=1 Tax=Halosimplex amylolyticum TaxID=3396616 RepID=UPI003F57ACF7